jgi:hypothetical protein
MMKQYYTRNCSSRGKLWLPLSNRLRKVSNKKKQATVIPQSKCWREVLSGCCSRLLPVAWRISSLATHTGVEHMCSLLTHSVRAAAEAAAAVTKYYNSCGLDSVRAAVVTSSRFL